LDKRLCARKEIALKMRSRLALLLTLILAAVFASNALATTPRDDAETPDTSEPEVGIATPAEAPGARVSRLATAAACSSGAHTLSRFGDRLYPEMGNGGYTSVHSDVYLAYDTATNMFLPGTHVVHTDRATQCLTDFSLDFERTNSQTAGGAGPNLTVESVTVDGQPATFTFVQPTYPGDPNGQDDPDPLAHAVSNANPVSATNPNPPACSPQVSGNSQNGTQCPANKLVITPATPIPDGARFVVNVAYSGRPGVHVDGDGSTEGWFRVNTAAAPNDGSFVTTEPVGTSSWLPLNNHPSAKPTYDFYDTVPVGKTAIANGELVGATIGSTNTTLTPTSVNPPDANFPGGSWTWHWHSPEPVANYLVENSIGSYDLVARTSSSGITYYQALASGLTSARKTAIRVNIDQHEDILEFQKGFAGPYPFTTAGIIVALPSVGFAEEMQTKITFGNGATSTPSLGTINHEQYHQWFGDNVSEASFNMTFWKEGFAQIREYFNTARTAANAAGGLGTPAGDAAFETSLINRFNTNYNTTSSTFWTGAPSNPTVGNLFTTANTYTRPGTAYLALWRILGRDRMIEAMKRIQATYGGGSITEPQLEAEFHQSLPNATAACHARLDQFFTQWFDTAYPSGGGANKPQITGPGLTGPGFTCAPTVTFNLAPATPTGNNGWYTGNVALTWNVDNGLDPSTTTTGCVNQTFSTDGTFTVSCTASNPVGTAGPVAVTVKRDATAPQSTATLTPTAVGAWYSPRSVMLSASDPTSGVASTSYRLDGGAWTPYTGPFLVVSYGPHTLDYRSTDAAGNVENAKTVSWGNDPVLDQIAGLSAFVSSLGLDKSLAAGLTDHLDDAARQIGRGKDPCGELGKFAKDVINGAGKPKPKLTFVQAHGLLSVNQIEAALGCATADAGQSAAEHGILTFIETVDGYGLADPAGTDLTNRARQIGERIANDDRHDNACRGLDELSKKIADDAKKNKLTAGQAARLGELVDEIATSIRC
jgi:hypothetical protein